MKPHFLAALLAAASIFRPAFAEDGETFTPQPADARLQATQYQVFNLGAVEGGESFARAVSSDGKAAGYVSFNIIGGKRPAIFERGKAPVPIFTDGRGEATGINRLREVVGWYVQGANRQGFIWKNNAITTILSPIGGQSHAAAINNSSVVVGWYEVSPGITHAFRHQNGVTTDLGNWGGRSSQATAINASGDIAGFREIQVNGQWVKQGVRLKATGTRQIIKPLAGFDNLVPTEINDTGDLAGSMSFNASEFPFDAAAFIVKGASGTTVTRLTPAGCCFGSVGYSLNSSRKVVGYRFDRLADPSELGRLWDVTAAQEISLYTLPEALAAGWWRLSEPSDINNNGVIVGQGAIRPASGGQLMRAFMLVPIPALTSPTAQ